MKKFFVFTAIMLLPVLILATSEADITFPIPELGNCASKEECITYCDDSANHEACDAFAEKHNLKRGDITFPIAELGNCNSEKECREYCEDTSNIRACFEFAKANDLMDEKELEEMEKVLPFLESGETPGGCTTKEACMEYCEVPEHFEECLNFIEKAGIVSSEEAQMIRKVGSFSGPGGCKGEECEDYCEKPENFETCINFAQEHGFMTAQEAEMIRRVGSFGGPGGCRSREECESFCEDPANLEVCLNFAEENGFISAEDAARMRKAGKFPKEGPGGCKGKQECETYCNDPNNFDTCINFAVENGFMTAEEAEMAKKGGSFNDVGPGGCKGREECESYCQDENHFEECVNFAHDKGFISEEEYNRAKEFRGQDFSGPGGCKGEECKTFCDDPANGETCYQWAVEHGYAEPREEQRGERQEGEQRTGPGGCRSEEECRAYCEQNPEQCGITSGGPTGETGEHPEGQFPEGTTETTSPPPTETTSPPLEEHREETSGTPTGQIIAVLRIFLKALKA